MRHSPAAILLVDDHELFARSLERHLKRVRPVVVAQTAKEAKRILADPSRRWCGFLFDVVLGDGSGLELLEIARRAHPRVPVLMMSGHDDHDAMSRAYVLGSTFVPKPFDEAQRNRFLAEVVAYEAGLDETLSAAVRDLATDAGLSKKQTQIVSLHVLRLPAKEILQHCNIKPATYKTHVRALLQKLGAESLDEVCRTVMERALPRATGSPASFGERYGRKPRALKRRQ